MTASRRSCSLTSTNGSRGVIYKPVRTHASGLHGRDNRWLRGPGHQVCARQGFEFPSAASILDKTRCGLSLDAARIMVCYIP
jgi:hypothetical protein